MISPVSTLMATTFTKSFAYITPFRPVAIAVTDPESFTVVLSLHSLAPTPSHSLFIFLFDFFFSFLLQEEEDVNNNDDNDDDDEEDEEEEEG
jgi:hypothetical protein